ncbi:SAM-dependent methyltransferase [Sphaerisporangium perillae]|uniref:SAM-dependent methyltransferase n=1 Tax=Sphaerisporangium perillae TaxID=2935860 RepID=UPI00200DBAA8|nr:SAM-dependent methyltransferase [Sphaerisporangium perillae]
MSGRDEDSGRQDEPAPEVDTSKPSIARVYDFMIGGTLNFPVDQQFGEMALRVAPDAKEVGVASRRFLRRAVRYMTAEVGIRQFLDLGSGLPTHGNVHQIAQEIDPAARVVYVDNDPMVLAHSRELLADDGTTAVIQADVRDPERILGHPTVGRLIDFTQPVGLLLLSILHHLHDDEGPGEVAATFREAIPPGSHMAVAHFFNPGEEHPQASEQAVNGERVFNEHLGTGRFRTREEILAFFGDLELVEPGIVPLSAWRPDPADPTELSLTLHTFAGGVARKP